MGREYVRSKVRERDKNTCQECGKVWVVGTRRFDVHHLNGLCGKRSRGYDKISEMDGLITLCHRCHIRLDSVRAKILTGRRGIDWTKKTKERNQRIVDLRGTGMDVVAIAEVVGLTKMRIYQILWASCG